MWEVLEPAFSTSMWYVLGGIVLFWPIELFWPEVRPGVKDKRSKELFGVLAMVLSMPFSLLAYLYLQRVFVELSGGRAPTTLFEGSGLLGSVLRVGVLVVVGDFFDYWVHRLMHSSVGWRFHYLHHLPKELNWRTGLLGTPIHYFFVGLPSTVLGWLLAASMNEYLAFLWLGIFIQHFLHLNVPVPKKGPVQLIGNPAFHRVHHASAIEHRDKNFAFFFPLWDRLFGTYLDPATMPAQFELGLTPKSVGILNVLGLRAPAEDTSIRPH